MFVNKQVDYDIYMYLILKLSGLVRQAPVSVH